MDRSSATCMSIVVFAASVFADLLDDTETLIFILTRSMDCVALILLALMHRLQCVRVSGFSKLLFPHIILITIKGIFVSQRRRYVF